jgi:uncharacterized protein (TIGR00369 family)
MGVWMKSVEVRGVDIAEVMKSSGGITRDLGVDFVELAPERVVATMPVDGRHHQPFGYLHGGVSVVLAESVASVGGFLNCPPGKAAFGAEISASHVRPKKTGTLTAVGTPVHVGRKSQVWEIRITDEEKRMICVSRCTVAVVDAE